MRRRQGIHFPLRWRDAANGSGVQFLSRVRRVGRTTSNSTRSASGSARAALEHRTIHIPDVFVDPEYVYGAKDVEPIRTVLGVPILKGDELLGVMMIYHLEVSPFTDQANRSGRDLRRSSGDSNRKRAAVRELRERTRRGGEAKPTTRTARRRPSRRNRAHGQAATFPASAGG